MKPHTCPYCQQITHLRGHQFPPHFAAPGVRCPVQWAAPGWRTSFRAAVRGLLDIIRDAPPPHRTPRVANQRRSPTDGWDSPPDATREF